MGGAGVRRLWQTEDWWSVWLGLGIVAFALMVHWCGGSVRDLVATPSRWQSSTAALRDVLTHGGAYAAMFLSFAGVFALSLRWMGESAWLFLRGFAVLFAIALLVFVLAGWSVMESLNVEAPLLALIVGLAVSNTIRVPAWLRPALRTEYFIKTGIVLLGATLPLTLIVTAGPVAFLQATLVSVVTWLTIYLVATRLFRLEPRFGAVLGAAGAVCGVSASIAVGGAVKARKDHISIAIAVVTVWAIVMIFALTIALKHLVPNPLSPGVAGAWVGTSEFADAAGLAVVAELVGRFGDTPLNAFTLMKVIGRDIWIGIWCLVLAVVSAVSWEGEKGGTRRRVSAGVVWERFPKFVLGFLAASLAMSAVSINGPAGYSGAAPMSGSYRGAPYQADFHDYHVPPELAGRFVVDQREGVLRYAGVMRREELASLTVAASTPDQVSALRQLHAATDWLANVLQPRVVAPVKQLRSWAFVFCFLSIGLSTRFSDLVTFGMKPFWAFTAGVLVNVPLGYILSTVVFVDFWSRI